MCRLNEKVNCYHKAKAAGATRGQPKEMHDQQLEYLSVGACGLVETISRRSMPKVVQSQKGLLLSLKKFKTGLDHMMGGSIMKADLQKVWEKKGEHACQGALNLADRFL
jgi:hypothetical protein